MSADAYYKCPECQTGSEDDETTTLASREYFYIEDGFFYADVDMYCDVCGYEFTHTFKKKMPVMKQQ
ncbi:MAG: hypothetical protein GY861_15560 [bacterium]|nr:hypothetical protein [bacterium]